MLHLPIITKLYLWICQGLGPLLSNLGEDHYEEHTIIWRAPQHTTPQPVIIVEEKDTSRETAHTSVTTCPVST